jgi:tRNA A37 threonylcarbamoyladenosine dehydratase
MTNEKNGRSQFSRTEMITGSEATEILLRKSVIIFGLGGVGSYAAEAVARAGVGNIALVDNDVVSLSNLNRQLCALHSTVGMLKTQVVSSRIMDINPECNVDCFNEFYLPGSETSIDLSRYDYVIDAIDTVKAKIGLAVRCSELNVPLISVMGTGNKLDPSRFLISDINKTSVCPLCKVMRYELRKLGVKKLNVVWSPEEPVKTEKNPENDNGRIPGSLPFVPGAAGLLAASKVIKDMIGI